MSAGPITRLILRLRRSGSSRKTVPAAGEGSVRQSLRDPSAAARRIVLDDATLDRLAAAGSATPPPGD